MSSTQALASSVSVLFIADMDSKVFTLMQSLFPGWMTALMKQVEKTRASIIVDPVSDASEIGSNNV